jgi:hypothetical protein
VAAEGPCLTQPEATAIFNYALPEMLASISKKCAAALPPKAFLTSQANQYVARYRTSAAANWSTAKAAFVKVAGADEKEGKILAALPDDTLKSLLGTGIGTAVTGDVNPADCPQIDRIVAALAPLPLTNISTIFVEILSLDGKKPGKKHDFRICEA